MASRSNPFPDTSISLAESVAQKKIPRPSCEPDRRTIISKLNVLTTSSYPDDTDLRESTPADHHAHNYQTSRLPGTQALAKIHRLSLVELLDLIPKV